MDTSDELPHPQERLTRQITDTPLPTKEEGDFCFGDPEPFTEGGGGILTRVQDLYLNRNVIPKTLKSEHRNNPDVTKRFLREARVTALIQHPATVPIYQMGRDEEDNPYFTMKEIRGNSLGRILKGIAAKDRTFEAYKSREMLIDLLIQVGQALAYAHACGVVHRDIKPDNIMIGAFGEVMVMDWGVAKIMDDHDEEHDQIHKLPTLLEDDDLDHTLSGKVYGTPRYMAPEQARGHTDVDERVDIFSLGAVLYECLIHRPLVFGNSREELLRKICEEPFISPAKKEPYRMIPPELDAIVMKALAKERDDRYADMNTFVLDLQRFRRGATVTVSPTTYRARIQRWVKANLPVKRTALLVGTGTVLGYLLKSILG